MESNEKEQKTKLRPEEILSTGMESTAGAIGAAIGFFVEGPAGAIAGGAAGPVAALSIRKVATEIKKRFLSPREEGRIATALTFAAERIRDNIEKGQQFRQDRFFANQPDDRSAAEEIVEAVLLGAQREYEEKKLRYHGNLLANLCFTTEVDRPMANLLIKLLDRISYRQVLLLSFLNRLNELGISRKSDIGELKNNGTMKFVRYDIIQETNDLQQLCLIEAEFISPSSINYQPRALKITELGKLLYDMTDLGKVKEEELDYFIALFS